MKGKSPTPNSDASSSRQNLAHSHRFSSRNRAFALVVTLFLIVLIVVFIVATISTVGLDSQATEANASAQNAKRLADTTLQTVISQIQEATTQGPQVAWASQPGMIRCYNDDGRETQWYKLYSAKEMIQTAPTTAGLQQLEADIPSTTWEDPGSPGYGVFIDLNSPILASDGSTRIYPILDPAMAKFTGTGTPIQGFDIDQSRRPPGNNTAPLPVRWLYVLKDGTFAPGEETGTPGTISVPGASRSNPITGRVAFWADDETCKININTAADGTYFDSPRFNSIAASAGATGTTQTEERRRLADRQFAVAPPIAKEFQRYIGHPAQTRLTTILPDVASTFNSMNRSRIMSSISPFLQWGGSEGGSKTIWEAATRVTLDQTPARATPYATLDEWIFSTKVVDSKRKPNQYTSLDGITKDLVTRQSLERLRFFLSPSSEAPEINLFGKPRIAMWPIHNNFLSNPNSKYTTRLDRMIAGSATLDASSDLPATYFFTRADSTSPTFDYDNIARNQALFEYLRKLSDTSIPGYGNDFSSKYGKPQMNQILTEIFDYVRSTNASDYMLIGVNSPTINDGATYTQDGPEDKINDFSYAKIRQGSGISGITQPGRGQVSPIYISAFGTKGFGRFHSISEVGVTFLRTSGTDSADNTTIKVAGLLNLGLFSPSLGPANLEANLCAVIEEIEPLKINGQSMFPPLPAGKTLRSAATFPPGSWEGGSTGDAFMWGGAAGIRPLQSRKYAIAANASNFPFVGKEMILDKNGTLEFGGGKLKIKLYWISIPTNVIANYDYPIPDEAHLIQEFTVTLPPISGLPMPKFGSPNLSTRLYEANFGAGGNGTNGDNQITANDTARSVVGKYDGDFRLIAAQKVVPEDAFAPHPDYTDASKNTAHSFRDPFRIGRFAAGGFSSTGKLVQDATYTPSQPVVGLLGTAPTSSPEQTGDWDNGPGALPDGPYINKQDEIGLQYFSFETDAYVYFYQANYSGGNAGRVFNTPNRILASPVMFGSLSTGVPVNGGPAVPWRTLLFRPQQNHFGQIERPKDSLMLDWFWMPVVEPFAISTTFATAGKVNMNYQLAPFTYVKRATALIATLGSETVISVPTTDGQKYKMTADASNGWNYKGDSQIQYRFPVKVLENDQVTAGENTGSLRQFKEKFDRGEIFRAASDICDIYLVPGDVMGENGAKAAEGESWTSDSQAEGYWNTHKLTGDNTRERPYNGLYSRLTTKSNTYTLHVRTQVIKPAPNAMDGTWIEDPKRIASEYRGSFTINRYLDREDPKIPDFSDSSHFNESIEKFYKYRVIDSRRFLP